MSHLYILGPGGVPIPEPDHMRWSRWMERQRQRPDGGMSVVGRTQVGPYLVMTDFLGIDHNWMPRGEPLLFETMIRAPHAFVNYQDRAHRIDEALSMHERAVAWVRASLTDTTAGEESEGMPLR